MKLEIITEYVALDHHLSRGPIEILEQGAAEVSIDLKNSILEIKLKIRL